SLEPMDVMDSRSRLQLQDVVLLRGLADALGEEEDPVVPREVDARVASLRHQLDEDAAIAVRTEPAAEVHEGAVEAQGRSEVLRKTLLSDGADLDARGRAGERDPVRGVGPEAVGRRQGGVEERSLAAQEDLELRGSRGRVVEHELL